jgi:hypothetical protein
MKRIVFLVLGLVFMANSAFAICENLKRYPAARWAWTECIVELAYTLFDSDGYDFDGDADGISG